MARTKKTAAGIEAVKRAVIYLRVSTTEQADSGLGLEAQERRCRAWATAQGWEVGGVFTDAGVSAAKLERPALQEALSSLTSGSVLLSLKLDRLTREVAHLSPLTKTIAAAGADWATVEERFDTTSACGRLMLRLMLEISQWEREVIGERTSAALQEKKARGERLGADPLGWVTGEDGQVEVDQAEQVTVARARALRAEGLTLRAIAAKLTEEGHPTKKGGRWQAETVRKVVETRYLEACGGVR